MRHTRRTPKQMHHPRDGLLEALERWREVDRPSDSPRLVPSLRVIDAHRATIEHAKGALMLRYGIDSCQAFAILVRWARVTHTPVPILAETLVHGICEGNPLTEHRERGLVRWLEAQLRHHTPDITAPLTASARAGAGA